MVEPRTSFIPKKSLASQEQQAPTKQRKAVYNFFFVLSVIVFALSLLGWGLTYSYQAYLQNNIEAMKESLQKAQAAFEAALIIELKDLNSRIDASEEILNYHVASSRIFELLEQVTLESVRLTDFSYRLEDGVPTLRLQGQGRNYSSVALQSSIFADSKFIKDPVFSDFGLDRTGNVVFSLTASVEPSFVSYKQLFE